MDWNDFEKDASWIDRFAFYLDPDNGPEISKNDLLSALAFAVAMYCDEYQNTCMLEDRITEAFGEEGLARLVEDAIPEDDVIRFIEVGEAITPKARAEAALRFLMDLKNGEGS